MCKCYMRHKYSGLFSFSLKFCHFSLEEGLSCVANIGCDYNPQLFCVIFLLCKLFSVKFVVVTFFRKICCVNFFP